MTSAANETASGPNSDDVEVSRRAWAALAIGAAGLVLFGFNSTATNLAFGSISDTFADSPDSLVSWVASGYFIASAAVLPLGGRLADRLGRRRVFNIGLLGFAASALVSALAQSIWVLIAARMAQAMSGALVIPSSLAMALPEFPESKRSSAVATWASAGPLSAAIAPSVAAALLQISSWRVVYVLSAPLAIVTYVLSLMFVSRSKAEHAPGRLDLVGTIVATLSIGLLVAGIGQAPTWGVFSGRFVGTIGGVLVGVGYFLFRSSRHPTPLLNLSLFKIPQVAVANLANLFMSTTSLSIWLVWPLWLGQVWNYSNTRIGLAITVGPICAGTATLTGGRLADRYGQQWLMIGGSALASGAVLWSYFMLGTEPNYLVEFMPTVMAFGLGWGLSNPSMNSWALATVSESVYGEVNAAFNTVRNLAAAIGISIAVAIVGSPDRVDVLAAYGRANLFFATSIMLSCITVAAGSWWASSRSG